MGCTEGKQMDSEEFERHRQIERELRKEKVRVQKEVKLLLLGAGEAGKSTFFKQTRILYQSGFSDAEREFYKDIIYANILLGIRTLISAADFLGLSLQDENREIAEKLTGMNAMSRVDIDTSMAQNILRLWKDPGMQEAFSQSHRFQLTGSFYYFMEHIDRVGSAGYTPTEEDILYCRSKTTGIVETQFDIDNAHFKIVDVGGQRGERVKWIHCFEDVVAIIFFAALSEYNQTLYEDDTVNRMHESLKLFDDIINSKWFSDTPVILFLNKSDLFKDKIKKYKISDYFPEYMGGDDFQEACDFITNKFTSLNEKEDTKKIYPHVTCCTDTENIRHVFASVKDSVSKEMLRSLYTFET
jgi:guanine nucleotide-binding protein subunit alpha